jgi:hypothetical protein
MSPRSDRFRVCGQSAERAASVAADPDVRVRFADIARSWRALAEMVDGGKVVRIPRSVRGTCT